MKRNSVITLALLGLFLLLPVTLCAQTNSRRQWYWRLRTDSRAAGDPIMGNGQGYHLISAGGSLAVRRPEGPNRGQVRVQLVPVNESGEVWKFSHQGTLGRVTGRRLVLNAPMSIYSETERAYLVYKEGAPLNLGFAYWEPHAEPEQPKPGGTFQWEFRSLETNDTTVAKTLEPLWLYNRKAQAYLFWHITEKKLIWLRP